MTEKHEQNIEQGAPQDPSGDTVHGAAGADPQGPGAQGASTADHSAAAQDNQEFYVYRGTGGKEYRLPIGFKDEMNKRITIERGKAHKEYQVEFENNSKNTLVESERLKAELSELRKGSELYNQNKKAEDEEYSKKIIDIKQRSEEYKKKYHDVLISTDLYASLSKFDVWNPSQIETIIKNSAKAEVDEKGKVSFNYQGEKIDSFELCKKILSMSENSNLIKSDGRKIEKQNTRKESSGGSFLRKDYNLRLKVSDVM